MPRTWARRIVWRTCFQEPRHLCLDGLGGQGMSRIGGHACRHNERQYPWFNNLTEFQSFNGIKFECCRP